MNSPAALNCETINPYTLEINPSETFVESKYSSAIFNGLALVAITAFICGCKFVSTPKANESSPFQLRFASVIASAAALASSNIEALAIGNPVRSQTTV